MRFISTKAHSAMDYVASLLLILVPLIWLDQGGAAIWVPVGVGIVMLVMALCTDYEYSAVNAISMPAHLTMDVIVGAFLAASPWLFGFADVVWIPHVILGIAEIGGALFTETSRRRPAIHPSAETTTRGPGKTTTEGTRVA